MTASSVAKLAVLLAWLTGIALAAGAARRIEAATPARAARYRRWLGGPAAAVTIAALALAPVAWASSLEASPLNASAVGRALAALRGLASTSMTAAARRGRRPSRLLRSTS